MKTSTRIPTVKLMRNSRLQTLDIYLLFSGKQNVKKNLSGVFRCADYVIGPVSGGVPYYNIDHFQSSRMAKALVILFLTGTVLSILPQAVLFAECRAVSVLLIRFI